MAAFWNEGVAKIIQTASQESEESTVRASTLSRHQVVALVQDDLAEWKMGAAAENRCGEGRDKISSSLSPALQRIQSMEYSLLRSVFQSIPAVMVNTAWILYN
jgi:hypothetical protein